MNSNIDTDRLRSYASIFSNSTFEKLIREKDSKYIKSKIKVYDKQIIQERNLTFEEYFKYIYSTLSSYYRNEYIYKNYIINKILLGKYSINTTTALNEFRVGKSIADLILLNGTSKVFEIKTELDKPDRLLNQIEDYKKVFEEIYIVTHHSLFSKYSKIVDKSVGIIILTENLSLSTYREAEINSYFNNLSIMKCLRKKEYSNILQDYYGEIPNVTDFKYFSTCKEMILKIPSKILQGLMVRELKNRKIKETELFSSNLIPMEFKHICFCLNLDKREYYEFKNILSNKVTIN